MASATTAGRRDRVRSLWTKPDAVIAEILVEEGYATGAIARTASAKRKQLAAMRRNVWNDRDWWRKQWRAAGRASSEDVNETRGEYLARLDSWITAAVEVLEDPRTKSTPKVQALSELRMLEQAKAKAHGVEALPPAQPDDDDEDDPPFAGLILTTGKLDAQTLKKIHGWQNKGGGKGGKKKKRGE